MCPRIPQFNGTNAEFAEWNTQISTWATWRSARNAIPVEHRHNSSVATDWEMHTFAFSFSRHTVDACRSCGIVLLNTLRLDNKFSHCLSLVQPPKYPGKWRLKRATHWCLFFHLITPQFRSSRKNSFMKCSFLRKNCSHWFTGSKWWQK